jgi:hypothetical protein
MPDKKKPGAVASPASAAASPASNDKKKKKKKGSKRSKKMPSIGDIRLPRYISRIMKTRRHPRLYDSCDVKSEVTAYLARGVQFAIEKHILPELANAKQPTITKDHVRQVLAAHLPLHRFKQVVKFADESVRLYEASLHPST